MSPLLFFITPAYISSPQRSEEEQKEHILCALVVHEADSTIERLVNCLAGDSVHSNHCFMARKLRDAIDAKKQHPECKHLLNSG